MSTTPPQKVTADPGRMMVSKLVSVWCSAYFQGRTASFWEVKHINKQNRQKVCHIVCCFETTSCWTMSSMTPLLTQQPAANSWFLTQNPSWDIITLSSRIVWSPICKKCISFVHCSKCFHYFHYCWRNHGKRWQNRFKKLWVPNTITTPGCFPTSCSWKINTSESRVSSTRDESQHLVVIVMYLENVPPQYKWYGGVGSIFIRQPRIFLNCQSKELTWMKSYYGHQ